MERDQHLCHRDVKCLLLQDLNHSWELNSYHHDRRSSKSLSRQDHRCQKSLSRPATEPPVPTALSAAAVNTEEEDTAFWNTYRDPTPQAPSDFMNTAAWKNWVSTNTRLETFKDFTDEEIITVLVNSFAGVRATVMMPPPKEVALATQEVVEVAQFGEKLKEHAQYVNNVMRRVLSKVRVESRSEKVAQVGLKEGTPSDPTSQKTLIKQSTKADHFHFSTLMISMKMVKTKESSAWKEKVKPTRYTSLTVRNKFNQFPLLVR